MGDDQSQRVRTIQLSMEESARPAFDDEDIEHLRALIRLTVDFYDYLRSAPPWPAFPGDPLHDMEYKIDSILFNVDSFRAILHSYGVLVGAKRSTIDWGALSVRSVIDQFVLVYDAFVAETNFERKCRLLLDLVKLQVVFAGAFYDCMG